MSRHALRRLLWIGPILIAVTLASFALLAYIPDPATDAAVVGLLAREQALELARMRFLDLPRFFNEHPVDVVRRAERAVDLIEAGGPSAELGGAELARLGGAALPYVLSRLDALAPGTRDEAARALRPVAERMGIATPDVSDPARAVASWNRFWSDRSIDFRPGNAHRVVGRLSAHTTSAREADLLELDTYALEQLMTTLAELSSRPATTEEGTDRGAALRRLIGAAAHVTGRDDLIANEASHEQREACVRRWREWWLVHRADFVAYDGPSRLLATIGDTQYGRWAEKVVVLGLGTGTDGVPVLQKLKTRAALTLGLVAAAIALAYMVAVAGAVVSEVIEKPAFDSATLLGALGLLLVPLAWVAPWVGAHSGKLRFPAAVLVLAYGLVAGPLLQVRGLLAEVRPRDYLRAARARGFSELRVVARHALRNAVLPITALGSVELPTALGGAFVVEKAFGLAGLGEETARAVQTRDVAWLVGVAMLTALVVTLTSIASDVLVATIDPRLTGAAIGHESAGS